MSTTIQVEIADALYPLPMFRATPESSFESFSDYAIRVVLPLIHEVCQDITVIRCSLTGYPVATIHDAEVSSMVRHAVDALQLNKLNNILDATPKPPVIIEAIESIIDHLAIRVTLQARPAPSLSFSNATFAMATLSEDRQLAALLNLFLFDSGQLRDSVSESSEIVERNRRSARVADQISAHYSDNEGLKSLRSLLVELDAKYRIAKLKFRRNELERLRVLRVAESLDVTELLDIVERVLAFRDKHSEIDVEKRWTQKVYQQDAIAKARHQYSNLVVQEKLKAAPIVPMSKVTPAAAKAMDNKARMAAMVADMFAMPFVKK